MRAVPIGFIRQLAQSQGLLANNISNFETTATLLGALCKKKVGKQVKSLGHTLTFSKGKVTIEGFFPYHSEQIKQKSQSKNDSLFMKSKARKRGLFMCSGNLESLQVFDV